MADNTEIDKNDIVKILLATDIHLGYNEKDRIRGEDSFNTFEEILQIATDQEVDFILLGGDLFHHSKPSANCIFKCTSLLRKYCLGNNPVTIQVISDQSVNFNDSTSLVNFEDPNQNISIPVFSIHGNHDDPVGMKVNRYSKLSSLDLFSTMGLINYFGKSTLTNRIEIEPIELQKGKTRIALYGLSHTKDSRLIKMIEESQVSFVSFDSDKWFSIFVVHQNRADRGLKTYLPESALPDFLDFVLWGHEHDCRIDPELSPQNDIYICQPGSSVATSLAEGEAGEKYVAVMEVYKKSFKLNKFRLKTVRPFLFHALEFSSYNFDTYSERKVHEQTERIVKFKVEEMIQESKALITGHPKQPTLPLIRLRIDYDSEDQLFNPARTGQMFDELVANPIDILALHKNCRVKRDKFTFDEKMMKDSNTFTEIETYVEEFFKNPDLPEDKKMKFLSVKSLCKAAKAFTEKSDYVAIEDVINYQCDKITNTLLDVDLEEQNINDKIEEYCQAIEEKKIEEEVSKILSDPKRLTQQKKNKTKEKESDDEELEGSDDELEVVSKESVRGKGVGKERQRKGEVKPDLSKSKKKQIKKNKSHYDQASEHSDSEEKRKTRYFKETHEKDNEVSIIEEYSSNEEQEKKCKKIVKKKTQMFPKKESKKKESSHLNLKNKQTKKSVFIVSSDSD